MAISKSKVSAPSTTEYLGDLLKSYRRSLGITGKALGQKLNVSQQQISRYERGVNALNIDMLMNFFQALEMDDNEIEYVFSLLLMFNRHHQD